jgi:beta-N-acetylhexosaminidase
VKIFLAVFVALNLFALDIKELASSLIMIGFDGYKAPAFLKKHKVAGVILFSKNISSPKQLKALTKELKTLQPDILIAVDEEGGKVERLKKRDGFKHFASAKEVKNPKKIYHEMAKMLKKHGINLNLAPVVDVAVNPKNPVIAKLNRSFSASPKEVVKKASVFVECMKKEGVLTSLKHFPGHGSSKKDSHKGFVDVSESWSKKELLPFMKVKSPLIMTAHIFNKKLDKKYPATLSYKTNTLLLRKKLGFKGAIISDDLQMGAISKNYTFKKALELAINSGVDILLIGNYLDKPVKIEKVISTIEELVKDGKVSKDRLLEAHDRIEKLKNMSR